MAAAAAAVAVCPAIGCQGDPVQCNLKHSQCHSCYDFFAHEKVGAEESTFTKHIQLPCPPKLNVNRDVKPNTMPQSEHAKWKREMAKLMRPESEIVSNVIKALSGEVTGTTYAQLREHFAGTATNPSFPGVAFYAIRSTQEINFPRSRHGFQPEVYRNIRNLYSELHTSHKELVDRALRDVEEQFQMRQTPTLQTPIPIRVDGSWTYNMRETLHSIMVAFVSTWLASLDVETGVYVTVEPTHELRRLNSEFSESFAEMAALKARHDRGLRAAPATKAHRTEPMTGCTNCGRLHLGKCTRKACTNLPEAIEAGNAEAAETGRTVTWKKL
jgi:hypothetical protein